MATTSAMRREAAAIIRRIVEALPLPGRVEAYLCGYADGLEANVDGGLATSTPEVDWPHDLSSATGLPSGRPWTVRARG